MGSIHPLSQLISTPIRQAEQNVHPRADGAVPTHHLHGIGSGHVARQANSRVTIHHDTDHPSQLLLPVTRGNRIGTFISGGVITS